ncbi:Heterogeneous nuclear ribonucleoprotein 1 [Linum perenne]
MQVSSESGKLFIGGISWDTNEERLREYFGSFGDVEEAVIMKDRTTGRARGFGFVVFTDGAVAERVTQEKHNIDGRMVEAKRAVPKDDQNIINRSPSNIQYGSPGQARTRKIFVGGLASTVTESDFRKYFEQFGTITDVVVMYDHNTQRPRGFGFITYDSEEAVDKVLLLKTFHELNGKMVEVKRAVPKELSPGGPSRDTSPLGGYVNNYGISRANSFLNGYNQGYNPNTVGYGLQMDQGRFSPIVASGGRSGFTHHPFGSGYGMGVNFAPTLRQAAYGGNAANFNGNLNYGRGMINPYYFENTNRYGSPVGYENGGSNNFGGNTSFFSSVTRNMWGNGGINYNTTSTTNSTDMENTYVESGGINGNTFDSDNNINWGSPTTLLAQGDEGNNIPNNSLAYGGSGVENNFSLGSACGYRRSSSRNNVTNTPTSTAIGFDGTFVDHLYIGGGSEDYGEPTWRSSSNVDIDGGGGVFGYSSQGNLPINNNVSPPDVPVKSPSPGFVGGYSVNKRQTNRGNKFLNYYLSESII